MEWSVCACDTITYYLLNIQSYLQAPNDSNEKRAYEEGIRFACLGMTVYSFSCLICSLTMEKIIRKFGYVPGNKYLMEGCDASRVKFESLVISLIKPYLFDLQTAQSLHNKHRYRYVIDVLHVLFQQQIRCNNIFIRQRRLILHYFHNTVYHSRPLSHLERGTYQAYRCHNYENY